MPKRTALALLMEETLIQKERLENPNPATIGTPAKRRKTEHGDLKALNEEKITTSNRILEQITQKYKQNSEQNSIRGHINTLKRLIEAPEEEQKEHTYQRLYTQQFTAPSGETGQSIQIQNLPELQETILKDLKEIKTLFLTDKREKAITTLTLCTQVINQFLKQYLELPRIYSQQCKQATADAMADLTCITSGPGFQTINQVIQTGKLPEGALTQTNIIRWVRQPEFNPITLLTTHQTKVNSYHPEDPSLACHHKEKRTKEKRLCNQKLTQAIAKFTQFCEIIQEIDLPSQTLTAPQTTPHQTQGSSRTNTTL